MAAAALLLIGAAGGYALRASQRPSAEARACALVSQIALDAGLRFDAKKAVIDAATIGRLVSKIDDKAIRLAAGDIARNLPHNLTTDDSDDLIAAQLVILLKACQDWQN